jgi:hypothetical protein
MRRHLKIMFATEICKKASECQKAVLVVKYIRAELINYRWWKCIEMECMYVEVERNKFRNNIYPGSALPKPYNKALSTLEPLLVNQAIYHTQRLAKSIPFAPSFYKY